MILGQGANGLVCRCYARGGESQGKAFAVKIMREPDEEKRLSHRREFDITQGLDHINIVKSHKYFFNELTENVHLVMDYVDGKEVLDLIASLC